MVVGVTEPVKTGELELAADETVPFNVIPGPGGVAVGEEGLVVVTESLVVGPVMSVADVVGELGGGVAVVLTDWGGGMVPDTLGDVPGPTMPDPGLVVAAAGGGVDPEVEEVPGVEAGPSGVEVVVGALGVVEGVKMGEMTGEMMLERRLPKGIELVVAAAAGESVGVGSEVGVTAGVVTPVEAAPVNPSDGVEVGVGVGVGVGRRALVNEFITPERGSVPGDEVAAGEGEESETAGSVVDAAGEGETAGSDVDAAGEGEFAGSGVVAVGEGVGVGVTGSSKLDKAPLRLATGSDGLGEGDAEVDAAAAAVAEDPPVPVNVTPSATGLLSLEIEELVVVPPVTIPPGQKVIPLPAAEDGDGTLTVVGEALSGVPAGL